MIYLLDILGSVIAGGLVLITLVQFNSTTSEMRNEFQSTHTIQSSAKCFSEVIDFDFYKAGFRVPHPDIFLAASDNTIKFLADLFNDGSIDTVEYYLGNTSKFYSTENPNIRPVFRKINSGSASAIGLVKDFKITCNDSARAPISNPLLETFNGRRMIKSISFNIIFESQLKNNETYQAAQWKKSIYPKNLN